MKDLIHPFSPLLRRYAIVELESSGSRKVKLSTVSSVNLRILEMSSMPPSLNALVILALSSRTSVMWVNAAFALELVFGVVVVWGVMVGG